MKPDHKESHLGGIPQDWEVATIGEVCSFSGGSQPPRSTFKFTPTPGYIRLIQIRDYKSDSFATYIPESLARKRCTAEDIMIGRYGPPIFQILRGIEGAYNVALIKTTLSKNVDREFFFNVLNQEPLFQLMESLSRRTSGQTGVELPALKAYVLPLPPLSEQKAIATALKDVDELLAGLDSLVTKKRDIKQAVMQQLLTGQTRLPGFTGEWRQIRLGESAILKARIGWQGLTTAEYRTSGDFTLVTGTEIREGKVDWTSCFYVSKDRYDQDRNIQLLPGDVLVTKDGTIGKAAIVRDLPRPATLNSGVFVIRPIRQAFDSGFFFGVLRSARFIEFLNQLAAGSTISHLYQKDFVHFIFEAPPSLAEQKAIATIFDDMDEEIRILEVRLAKTLKIKLGMMQQLLTGKVRLS